MPKYLNRLRTVRNDVIPGQRPLSQRAVAEAIGIPAARYWEIENGYTEATPREKKALAKELKATIEDLFPPSEARAS